MTKGNHIRKPLVQIFPENGGELVGKLVRHQWKYMEDKEDDKKQGSSEQRWSNKFVNDTCAQQKNGTAPNFYIVKAKNKNIREKIQNAMAF